MPGSTGAPAEFRHRFRETPRHSRRPGRLLPRPAHHDRVGVARSQAHFPGGPDDVGFDGWGAGLALFSLAPLVAGLIEGPALGWTSRWTLGLLLFGVIMLVSFVIRERSTPNPAFDVEALSRPRVAAAALILSAAYVTFMGVLFLVTIELQDLAGLGPIGYGLVLTPMSVSYWLTSRLGAHLAATGRIVTSIWCGLAACVAAFVIPGIAPNTVPWTLPALILMGVGNGLLVPVAAAVVLNALSDRELGTSSALSVVARFAGGAVGVAVIASALASAPLVDQGITWGYWAGAALVLALAVAAGLLVARVRAMSKRGTVGGDRAAGQSRPV